MSTLTRRGMLGSLTGAAAATALPAQQRKAGRPKIKITDVRCAIIGQSPVVRIVTDQGVSGYGQAETRKVYLRPMVMFYKDYILGEDPTDVERVMMKIRRLGAFKPWGAAVSAIEIALWDIAGQVAGVPVYKLMGGKTRDRVRVYNGGFRPRFNGQEPQHYAEVVQQMKEAPEGFTLIKMAVAFHNAAQMNAMPGQWYDEPRGGTPHGNKGMLTEKGLKRIVASVEAMKKVLGDEVGLALDAGPGWMMKDAVNFCKAVEPMHLAWVEDLLTGDYTPYPNADLFRDLKMQTSVPIHTGEQIYNRLNFKDLIEKQAVDVLGPDPEDVGGIGELKWITEYADLHGILMAPHGIFDGLVGLAAHVHMAATLPQNYIAFEYPYGQPEWWYDIVDGLPNPIVKKGFIDVWDSPGLGVTFKVNAAKARLSPEDRGFFD
ncbi:MAG: mandelate racemase/muconate lactonizing enzyme family protein [Bryobacterales bacterium]|nr:mandelate racemase/muconate lactonizing enzyme family protein [Bryobacterales bacterium]